VVSFVRGAIPPDAQAWIDRYPSIHHPTLVIRGEHDTILDRPSAERFVRTLPRAKFLHIPACGHAAQEESPEVVVPALLEFFNGRT
jgi:pimeloyl-ACP methyl ester carboxylesterase